MLTLLPEICRIAGMTTGWVASVVLFWIFINAARQKANDINAFADSISHYRLVPPTAQRLAAYLIVSAEATAAVLLVFESTYRAGAALCALLISLFVMASLVVIYRGDDPVDCACGGDAHILVSWPLVFRNLTLLLIAILAFCIPRDVAISHYEIGVVSITSIVLLILYAIANTILSTMHHVRALREE